MVFIDAFRCEPVVEPYGPLTAEDVAEVAERMACFGLRVDDLFVQSTGFADLGHGVVAESLAAEL